MPVMGFTEISKLSFPCENSNNLIVRVYEQINETDNYSTIQMEYAIELNGETALIPAGLVYTTRCTINKETERQIELYTVENMDPLIDHEMTSDYTLHIGASKEFIIYHNDEGIGSFVFDVIAEDTLNNPMHPLSSIATGFGEITLTPIDISNVQKDFSIEDKEALRNNTAAIRAKLIVKETDNDGEIILTDNDSIKSLTYNDDRYVPDQGWIGQFVARTLEGELQNITEGFNIENRTIEFLLGVYRFNDKITTWYSFGNFIVTKPENDDVTDNTKFTAMDYTKKFNQEFDGDFTNINFQESLNTKILQNKTYSALWLARYTCAQVGIDFPQETFTNATFQLNNNPFKNRETCRDVMKEIAKLAFSWVRVDWNNKCYIDFTKGDTSEIDKYLTIDNNQYFTLETQKNTYGPINKVVFGISGIDGESIAITDDNSINEYGETAIYIYDNPLLPTFDIRAEAVKQGNVLFGLSYVPLKTETIGHPWFKGNRAIKILDMSGNSKTTYPFNKQLKYNGHIRSIIESTGETDVEATYAYNDKLLKELRHAMITVDKQEGIITDHTNRLEVVEDEFGNYYTVEQTNELINDARTGLTNTYTTAGGNNVFKNTGLYFTDENGYEYWSGSVIAERNIDSDSGYSMLLQNGNLIQTMNDLPNGEYTISFGYEKRLDSSTTSVYINGIQFLLENQGKFEQTFLIENNVIEIQFTTNINNSYVIWDLMCNKGTVAQPWTQHPNEVRTDMVNISKGITITSTAINATFKADADGIRIENESENKTTEFTDDGMETDIAVVRKQGQITGALFTKVADQTWINGL